MGARDLRGEKGGEKWQEREKPQSGHMGWQWQLRGFDGVFGLSQPFPDICQGCQREMLKAKGWEEEEDEKAGGIRSMGGEIHGKSYGRALGAAR